MNYNSFYNKPTLNHKELIGDNKASDIGGMTEEDMQELLETDLTPYYSKDEIDDLFSRSFVYREKSGSIVTFDCPSTSQSIPEVTVGIEAMQSGSGNPSPTNVRPISGWSAVNVSDVGKNKFDLDAVTSFIKVGVVSTQGLTNQDGVITNSKSYGSNGIFPFNYPMTFSSNTITVSADIKLSGNHSSNNVFIQMYNSNGSSIISNGEVTMSSKDTWEHKTITLQPSLLTNVNLAIEARGTNNSVQIKNVQVEIGSASEYEPYNGTTYTTALKDGQGNPLTCYGGQLTNQNGVQTLVLTHGYIASYNGETLPSTWISDRDVYAEGTTPTTGAEVVYELATPQQIPQDSLSIATQDGTNNLWADSGDIEVKCLDRIIPARE